MIKVQQIKEVLNLRSFGAKGWLSNKNIACPSCGRTGKFGLKFDEKGGSVNCFYCEYSTHISAYLKLIDRKDLVTVEREISITSKLKNITAEKEVEEVKEIEEVKLPKGFKRVYQDDYLDSRGFLPYHYEQFEVGITESFLEKKLRNYLIFSIFQDGKRLSWLARSKYSYEWHSENLKRNKEGLEYLVLRYRNSDGTEFDKILGGSDEITDNTHTVILVEGLMDSTNTDRVLRLRETEDVRCCFTFGNKISDSQIEILKKKKSVETIILMYDEGTIKQSKTYGLKLSKSFDTYVTLNKDPNTDPGNMNLEFAINLLKTKQKALEFYINTINKGRWN